MSLPESSPNEPPPEGSAPPPKSSSALPVVITLALLAAVVWWLSPSRVHLTPAPLQPRPAACAASPGGFTPTNITSVADPPLDGLSPRVRNRVLLRMNMEPCTCGCERSIAACRAANPKCATSRPLAESIVREEQGDEGGTAAPPARNQ